jgi:tRNA threonylcarbamoyladenosine biosynthesis protein TsaB
MFTSLRVGLALAKGFSCAQNIPVVGVNTLDVIGLSLSFSEYPVLAVINAYRKEIYAALYEQGERKTDYLLTTPVKVKEMINEQTLVVGSGTVVFKEFESSFVDKTLKLINADFLQPTASKVISVALPRINDRNFDDPEILEPYYIKKTDAERNYNKTDAP